MTQQQTQTFHSIIKAGIVEIESFKAIQPLKGDPLFLDILRVSKVRETQQVETVFMAPSEACAAVSSTPQKNQIAGLCLLNNQDLRQIRGAQVDRRLSIRTWDGATLAELRKYGGDRVAFFGNHNRYGGGYFNLGGKKDANFVVSI